MRFGNCSDCGKYKYIKSGGLCPTCAGDGSVKIKLDIIDDSLRTPDMLKTIADSMTRVQGVECSGDNIDGDKKDDLDLKDEFCRLFEAEEKFEYSNYNGSKDDKVRSAIIDALKQARNIYN